MKKYVVICLIAIVLVMADVVTLIWVMGTGRHEAAESAATGCCARQWDAVQALELTERQQAAFDSIKDHYRSHCAETNGELKECQRKMLSCWGQIVPDSAAIATTEQQIGQLQQELLHLSMQQYHDLLMVLDKQQQDVFSQRYEDLMGCGSCCNR